MTQAICALKDLGARKVYCCATHALLSGPASDRLREAPVEELAVTNTMGIDESRRFDHLLILSVGDLLGRAIGYTHSDQSVSSLFE